jgi:sodium transport system ATP-binding protein
MIQVHHLTKTYEDPDGGEVTAVSDAVLTCNAGEIYGLLGANGAGKTTTLRCLATILTPTSGTATIAGHDLLKEPEAVRRSIGFLSASTGLYARLTPRETLTFFGSLHGLKGEELEGRVDEVIGLFDIAGYADRPNDRLSTGMKQRVGLARAVVHDPPVLVLDEPTSGLDPIVSRTVEQAVLSLARSGKCVLFSTHLLSQAEDICSRIGVIGNGRVLGEGTIPELCARTGTRNLREAFFALAGDESPKTNPPLPPAGEGRGEGEAQGVELPSDADRSATFPPHPDPLPHGAEGARKGLWTHGGPR